MKFHILVALCTIACAAIATAQVPSLINYQGRLTDADGVPVTGSKNFTISIYDAATNGTLLYTETIGAVTLDDNGVYSFQFGESGTSNTLVTETIGTTVGSTLDYTKTLSNTPVIANSIAVTDGTNSWSQSVGNPGATATATASTVSGFVIGATVTSSGSGYSSAPTITITGNGTGAAATATISNGQVTGVTITSAGSGYTGSTTITIAPPVIPFRVDFSQGTITATYSSAPTAGRAITATYRYGTSGITGALSNGTEHWMAISVDGTMQGSRQRVLAVPFASRSRTADFASKSDVNLSDYQGYSCDITYQAPSSGFIIASRDWIPPSFQECWIKVGNTPDSLGLITYGRYQGVSGNSFGSQQTVPIKKGRYWRCSNFDRVLFVAFE
jgi:hypothetical protein